MRFISSKTHTVIGLIVGLLLMLAPQLFNFSSNQTATTVTVGVGIFIILSELITTSRMSPLRIVPMSAHLVIDYLTGIFIILSPWFFGFTDTVWLPHVVVGILVVGYALFTDPTEGVKELPVM